MEPPTTAPPSRLILFDLDGTLFDHYHSLRSAISAIRASPTWQHQLTTQHSLTHLIDTYNRALQLAYDEYLAGTITYSDTEARKVTLFFTSLGLPPPSQSEIAEFRSTYKPAYRSNRRATPGAVETLVRLREHGCRLAIVTNGQTEDQISKAAAIGVGRLVDGVLTSEEAQCCKPDPGIFRIAVDSFGGGAAASSSCQTYMVGDAVDTDIKGAIAAGLTPILYNPVAPRGESHILVSETHQIPVITHMSQLLAHLGVSEPSFTLSFDTTVNIDTLVIRGMGIDLVTEPRHCMCISQDDVRFLANSIGEILLILASSQGEGNIITAMCALEAMIRAIARVAMPINEAGLEISFPGQGAALNASFIRTGDNGGSTCTSIQPVITAREHSIRAEFPELVLNLNVDRSDDDDIGGSERTQGVRGDGDGTDRDKVTMLREIATLLQVHCNDLMRDYPRAAVRNLRAAMLVLAARAGIGGKTIIRGEKIDE